MPFVRTVAVAEPLSICPDHSYETVLPSGKGSVRALGVVTWGTMVALEEVDEVLDIVEGGAGLGGCVLVFGNPCGRPAIDARLSFNPTIRRVCG